MPITLAALSCGGAARAFLDIPDEPNRQEEAARTRQGAATSLAPRQDTLGPPPPIEAVSDPDSVVALLPKDDAGNIDWVAALRTGVIRPRRGPPGISLPPDMRGFGFDFLFKGPAPMFDASFPHGAHVKWLSCRTCHPAIFRYRNEPITMQAINQGEACGRCHGKVAFPASTCERCHTQMSMPAGRNQPELLGNLVFTRTPDSAATPGSSFEPAVFPHWVHRIRYRCMACHPTLFEARAGAAILTMDEMGQRKGCGACHDGGTAFALFECSRCHVAEPASRDSVP